MSLPGNPYDGHTLGAQLDQVARITASKPTRAYVDRGYRGHGVDRQGLQVHDSHTRGITSPTIRRELRRRNAIEPVIGHMKQDGHLERNALKGAGGDAINVLLCAIGHNFRLLLAWFRQLLLLILAAILFPQSPAHIRLACKNRILHTRLGIIPSGECCTSFWNPRPPYRLVLYFNSKFRN